jgi:hypothetical protein
MKIAALENVTVEKNGLVEKLTCLDWCPNERIPVPEAYVIRKIQEVGRFLESLKLLYTDIWGL